MNLQSGMAPGPLADFGVREERHRVGISRKIQWLRREMEQSLSATHLVCDPARYQNMLLRIRKRINED